MEIINYLWFALYGLIAGILAKTALPGRDEGGLILTMALGVSGSLVGGFLFSLLGWPANKGFSLEGLIPAFLGSVAILLAFGLLKRRFR